MGVTWEKHTETGDTYWILKVAQKPETIGKQERHNKPNSGKQISNQMWAAAGTNDICYIIGTNCFMVIISKISAVLLRGLKLKSNFVLKTSGQSLHHTCRLIHKVITIPFMLLTLLKQLLYVFQTQSFLTNQMRSQLHSCSLHVCKVVKALDRERHHGQGNLTIWGTRVPGRETLF